MHVSGSVVLLLCFWKIDVFGFLFPAPSTSSCSTCTCPTAICPAQPSCPPVAACPAPVSNPCCDTCRSCKKERFRRSILSNATYIVAEDVLTNTNSLSKKQKREISKENLDSDKCNSPALQQIILQNIDRVTSIGKKRMQEVAESTLGARYNVICARGDFSYIANTEEYCQQTVGDVTCFLFKQLSDVRFFSNARPGDPHKLVDLEAYTPDKIRNFGIVAHVDHGKSTLADRILELCGVAAPGQQQMLDRLQVEKERGITVKAQTASLPYKGYLVNLIDTPGHVDFSAEVSRSLAVCDGIVLLVAANEGVQAQTVANFWLAFEKDITIIPVINKIDLPGADVKMVTSQLKTLFDIEENECVLISAKKGLNVGQVLDKVVENIPPPKADPKKVFRGLLFDSYFDNYRGAIAHVLVKEGSLQKGQKISSYHNGRSYEVSEVGIMRPEMIRCSQLFAGQVGYVVCNMKTVAEALIGETLYSASLDRKDVVPFEGMKLVQPTVYAGLFPVESADYENLKQAVERLCLNDSSVTVTPDSSRALGLGWRIGFLGVLHMEVFGARLSQEYDASVILCQPSVEYRAIIKDNDTIRKRYDGKSEIRILDPGKFPDHFDVEEFLEPMVKVRMIVPSSMMGVVNGLCSECRGERGDINSIDEQRMIIVWRLPLAEVVVDFFERLKKLTSGYASFDYENDGYNSSKLVKLAILINEKEVSEFSQIIPAAMARDRARLLLHRLKREIPRQQFEVVIKACIGQSTKALSQVVIQPMKRDFSQLLKGNFGGGGMERLNKKLSHQKKGKERMKTLGNVQIPKEAFLNILKN
ncbi:unnamed protein product [Caenorhabditis auriculariae]|uniref:Translation factor GUF1 homolog, mitochondrial n=1 Tax=Caenorhabditis auriculariae TaxID=2777116 RepID=A0A8S1GZF1_9PELO|nr:unnamed protein product [Caenorhabditis auriculariae]